MLDQVINDDKNAKTDQLIKMVEENLSLEKLAI